MNDEAVCSIVARLARELRYMARDCENQAIYGRNNADRALILAARSDAYSRASQLVEGALEEVRSVCDSVEEVNCVASQ